MDVILYNPRSSRQGKPVLPMSLLALGVLLEGEHDYAIVDGNLEPDPVAAIDSRLGETDSAVLGVTVMPGQQLRYAVAHSQQLKDLHPDLTIVWGGYFPTEHYAVCLRAACVDYVVRGHGEVAFKELVDRLRPGENVTSLAGLAYRDQESDEIKTNARAPVPHPDQLPDFPYHRLDLSRYTRRTFLGNRTLAHHSSYGCPFLCNFCAVVRMTGGRWKPQSAKRTASVVRRLVERHGADAVEFYDNDFFVREARTAEFAERVMELGISWWGESRIDTLLSYSNVTWERMRDSGLRMVFMGAESGSDKTLERINKGGTASTEKTLALAAKTKAYGIIPEYSFMLGSPPDPEEDVERSIEFIREVKRVNPATEIIMYLYTPVRLGGYLYDQARAAGFEFPETVDEWTGSEWHAFSQRRSRQMPWVQNSLRDRIRDFESVLNAYYPTSTDPTLRGIRRWILKAMSGWRYYLRFYRYPLGLRALQKVLAYQRPETSGF